LSLFCRFLLALCAFSEEFAEETRLFRVIGMTLAAILLGNTLKGYLDVLATP
jgi:hypothetical protein